MFCVISACLLLALSVVSRPVFEGLSVPVTGQPPADGAASHGQRFSNLTIRHAVGYYCGSAVINDKLHSFTIQDTESSAVGKVIQLSHAWHSRRPQGRNRRNYIDIGSQREMKIVMGRDSKYGNT